MKRKIMKEEYKLISLDELTNVCGFFTSEYPVNNYYGCKHKECSESEAGFKKDNEFYVLSDNLEISKGRKIIRLGKCYSFSCPLGFVAEKEDFIRFKEDPEYMTVGEWMIIKKTLKKH